MKKFKVLAYNEYAFVKVGVYSTRNDNNVFYHSFSPYYILFNLIIFVIAGVNTVFIFLNVSEINDALRTAISTLAAAQTVGMFLSYGMNTSKMQALHFKLQKNVDKTFAGK